jgi:hypothetical protein
VTLGRPSVRPGVLEHRKFATVQRFHDMRLICHRAIYVILAASIVESLSFGIVSEGMGGVAALRPQQFKRIALEGNIAAGKSTLLRLLEDEVGYLVVPEPISKWQSVSPSGSKSCGGNLLELFYTDPKRWGFTFQMYAFLSRTMAQLNPVESYLNNSDVRHSRKAIAENATSVIFFERSVLRSTPRHQQLPAHTIHPAPPRPTNIATTSVTDLPHPAPCASSNPVWRHPGSAVPPHLPRASKSDGPHRILTA